MRRIKKHLTGEAAALASVLVVVAGLSPQLSVAVIFLACVTVSYLKPRWAESRGLLVEGHPAALSAAIAFVLVSASGLVGIDLSQEQAVSIAGGLPILVSAFTPRDVN